MKDTIKKIYIFNELWFSKGKEVGADQRRNED